MESSKSHKPAKKVGMMDEEIEGLRSQIKLIEGELERRAAEVKVEIQGKTTLERIQDIFNATAARHEKAIQKVENL